ncbi:MAG: hypothetical protein M3Z75_06505 [Actinomycetota bacterium]|nr:hypothetical protein [Actinomycetota bacterium]
MSPEGKRRFAVAADSGTRPSADESAGVTTSGRRDFAKPGGGLQGRTAYTWRLTADQALTMDDLMLRLKRELGRGKLDKAEMLAALVGLAAGNPAIFGALVAQLQAE